MKKQFLLAGSGALIILSSLTYGAEGSLRNRGADGTGFITINLELTEDISAGFLKTSLGDPDSELNEMLSTELVQTIRNETGTTLPFCVMSSGGGYFEVSFFEEPGSAVDNNSGSGARDGIRSGINSSPIAISFGDEALSSIKYQSVTDECNPATAIPVTINLNEQYTGEDAGRIYGRVNLLVKSE